MVGSIQPCSTSGAPTAATARPPRPVATSSAGGLAREIVQQREPHRLVAPRIGHEFVAPARRWPRTPSVRRGPGSSPWRGRRARPARRARWTRQPVDAPPPQHRRAGGIGQERQQRERQRPGDHARASPARRRGSARRRRPAPPYGRRNTRSSRRPASPARPGRRSGASADRPAPARPACGRDRRASRPAAGRPCRAPATIPASAAAPATGAAASSSTTSSSDGASARTAAMISAPSTPTPMKATTRPMPQDTVTASCRRHGRMNPSSVADGLRPADLGGILREVSHHGAGVLDRRGRSAAASMRPSGADRVAGVRRAAGPSAGDTGRRARSARHGGRSPPPRRRPAPGCGRR